MNRAGAAFTVGVLLAAACVSLTFAPSASSAATLRAANDETPERTAGLRRASPSSPATIVTPDQDVPNPFVLFQAGTYYLYSSQTDFYAPLIALRTSTDRINWSAPVTALPEPPEWADIGFTWAPDVRKAGDRYVMYFTARVRDRVPGTQCIGTATADTPMGPFVPDPKKLVCQLDHWGSIDPRTFVDADGTLWLHWKSDDNADIDGPGHAFIYAQRLSKDGLRFVGERSAILTADRPWEGRIVEAPHMVRAAGRYWLFYSGNWFNQPVYAVGVAKCDGPAGPCSKPFPSPFLWSNSQGSGPGESSLLRDPSGWWLFYAPWAQEFETPTPRPVALARVAFTKHGPYLAES